MLLRPFGPYPDKDVIAQLDSYMGVPFDRIVIVDHQRKLALAKSKIASAPYNALRGR